MEIKIIPADETKIRELKNGSAFTWKGELMNQIYQLTGSNAYPEDLTFVSIPLSMFNNNIGKLALVKFQLGARWLDDIVDNNARRELGK